VDRLACIDLFAFPLQLLFRRHPEWVDKPAAVVEADKPQARILWLNEAARTQGVLPGMRYAAGLSLAAELCADVIDGAAIADGVALVAEAVRKLSPQVEPALDNPDIEDPGVFWIGAAGLERLHHSPRAWSRCLHATLGKLGFEGQIAVGYRRFFTFALARARMQSRTLIVASPQRERELALAVPLDRLALSPKARDGLAALGVRTVADLLRLPAGGARSRFGSEVLRLHRAARGELETPVLAKPAPECARQHMVLDHPETNARRLLFALKRLLDPLLEALVARQQAVRELVLELKFENGTAQEERLRPADATVDARQLLDLLLLRLDALKFPDGANDIALDAETVPATRAQLELFAQQCRRDPAAARRAFARLRAEFGERTVVRADLMNRHLPEASFRWVPLFCTATTPPKARLVERTLVRRLYGRPLPLPHRPKHEEDGWQLRGRTDSPAELVLGPYLVSGGWWRSAEPMPIERAYHYVHNQKGDWLWTYFDPVKRRWFLHGRVE